MKKMITMFIAALLAFMMVGTAGAATYTFQPDDPDLGDLDHYYAYTWDILDPDDWEIADNEVIVGASLFFDDIRNYNDSDNDLWVHLLDSTSDDKFNDGNDNQDYFAGQGIELFHWSDLSSTAQDLTYDFDSSEIATLISYFENDNEFGFGLDPDCHFYNNGVTFTIETASAPVPEPGTMLLLGSGLIGLTGLRRKLRNKSVK